MLTLRQCSERDAVVTLVYSNHHPRKIQIPEFARILEFRELHFQKLPLQSYQVLVVTIEIVKH